MRSNKTFLVIFGWLLVFSGVVVSILLVRQRQELRIRAEPMSKLSFDPAVKTVSPQESFILNVLLDSQENVIAAAELHVAYDPEFFQVLSISPGSFFGTSPVEFKKDSSLPGQITYILGSSPDQPQKGQGVLARINFSVSEDAQEGATSEISFLRPQTRAAAIKEGGQDVVTEVSPAVLAIAVGPTSTPSLSPTPSPSPTATISQEAEPTLTPTVSPTPGNGQEATTTPTGPTPTGITPTATLVSTTTPTIVATPTITGTLPATATPSGPTPTVSPPVSGTVSFTLGLGILGLILLLIGVLSFLT